jgi:methylated-DNA-protein-cysteine methyltransferase-like protein
MTYGQIASILGEGYTPRTVGYVMHGADAEKVPWQRVINAQGKCSTGRLILPHNLQQQLLEAEGIAFSKSGKCDLEKYLWFPPGSEPEDDGKVTLFDK